MNSTQIIADTLTQLKESNLGSGRLTALYAFYATMPKAIA